MVEITFCAFCLEAPLRCAGLPTVGGLGLRRHGQPASRRELMPLAVRPGTVGHAMIIVTYAIAVLHL